MFSRKYQTQARIAGIHVPGRSTRLFQMIALLACGFSICASTMAAEPSAPAITAPTATLNEIHSAPSAKAPPRPKAARARTVPAGLTVAPALFQRTIVLPPLSPAILDELKRQDSEKRQRRLRIGIGRSLDQPIIVDAAVVSPTEWTLLPNGWRVLSVSINSQGALGLRLHLEDLQLPDGVRLVSYDPAASSPDAEPITRQTLAGSREVWSPTLFAEGAVIECHVPPSIDLTNVSFTIRALSHRYRSLLPPQRDLAGICEKDVTCYSAYADQAAATARMEFVDGLDTYLCTGCLLNDTDPSTFIDYFLTANHCIDSQKVASTLELFWFYQTATCGGLPPSLFSVPHTIGGADFLAGSDSNDFAFLRLRQPSPDGVTYVGWTTTFPSTAETVACIEHPAGDYKRISFGNVLGTQDAFWEIRWSSGITEEGSSGSALLNANHQVIGQLYGGDSACGNPTGTDIFGKFNLTYPRVRQWLDNQRPLFVPSKSTYNGLFSETNQVRHETSGSFTLKESPAGNYTASFQLAGVRYSFTGQFDVSGNDGRSVPRRGATPLTVTLAVNAAGDSRLTGTIGDGQWVAQLVADPVVFDIRTNPAPFSGRYTLVIPGSPGDATIPAGHGFGSLTVDAAGRVRLTGSLADGAALSQSSQLSARGDWPLYISLYGGKGSILGWISFSNQATDDLHGQLNWVRPAQPSSRLYPAGFTRQISAVGSSYLPPATVSTPVLPSSEEEVSFDGGNLTTPFANHVTLRSGNKILNDSTNKLTLTFTLPTGLFKGNVTPPGLTRSIPYRGALFQKLGLGYGYFLGPTQSGSVSLSPQQ